MAEFPATTIASAILILHLLWIALVIFGAFFTRGRPVWTTLHILALCWGIATEVGPWPCPLTLAEQFFEDRAGMAAWHGSFILHTLDAILYPNLPYWIVTVLGVSVCVFNLGIYGRRLYKRQRSSRTAV